MSGLSEKQDLIWMLLVSVFPEGAVAQGLPLGSGRCLKLPTSDRRCGEAGSQDSALHTYILQEAYPHLPAVLQTLLDAAL